MSKTSQHEYAPDFKSLSSVRGHNRLRRKLAEERSRRAAFFLHSSAVVHRGRVYLFSGPSSSGKSTIARFFPRVYSDELNLVRRGRVYPAVFSSEVRPTVFASSGISAFFFLRRSNRTVRKKLVPGDFFRKVLRNIFVPFSASGIKTPLLKFWQENRHIPAYELGLKYPFSRKEILDVLG
ncbi:MAG TPA: hypothetical protein VJC03_05455 [bacterium]|nr:hypothetical protein [bacterium]